MKWIEYKVGYGNGQETIVGVYARSIASGMRKVAKNVDRNIPAEWGSVYSIRFWKCDQGVK